MNTAEGRDGLPLLRKWHETGCGRPGFAAEWALDVLRWPTVVNALRLTIPCIPFMLGFKDDPSCQSERMRPYCQECQTVSEIRCQASIGTSDGV